MILVDTSVWIDHFRSANPTLANLLRHDLVLSHPHVIGELSLGNVSFGPDATREFDGLPPAVLASDNEVLRLIRDKRLARTGIGYVDAHLLTATLLTENSRLWTHDTRLAAVAGRLGVGAKFHR